MKDTDISHFDGESPLPFQYFVFQQYVASYLQRLLKYHSRGILVDIPARWLLIAEYMEARSRTLTGEDLEEGLHWSIDWMAGFEKDETRQELGRHVRVGTFEIGLGNRLAW